MKNFLPYIKEVISLEYNELQNLFDRIDDSYQKVIEILLHCKGKIVVVGIGKSAHIGRKMVATFNSTGTISQFLHAAEAIHGDLGILQQNDVVICISNSGNSPEIKAIIPFLKKNAKNLIAITGNLQSNLAQNADFVLDASVQKEACPNNLAPTSSTTVQIVIGDALAVTLMKLKGFTENDFASYHPGGNLGKNLLWTLEQFNVEKHKPFVNAEAPIKEVIISISKSKNGITVVLENDAIIGVITDGDLRRMLTEYDDFGSLVAKDIMSKNPKTIAITEKASKALEILKTHNIGQLVVLENNVYKGIIDLHQLLDEGIK